MTTRSAGVIGGFGAEIGREARLEEERGDAMKEEKESACFLLHSASRTFFVTASFN
jgi:hypothetical protein